VKPLAPKNLKKTSSETTGRRRKAARTYRETMFEGEERDRLIENYLPLVKSIITRMRIHFPQSVDTDDLYGIGVQGLILAVNNFDGSKGRSFGGYAALRIKGGLLDELRRIDCLPRSSRAKAKSLQATIEKLEGRYKRPVTEDEVRDELGLRKDQYQALLRETQPVTFLPIDGSMKEGAGKEAPSTLEEALADPNEPDVRDLVEDRERVLILRDRIKELPDMQKKTLVLYYYEGLKLTEIAEIFGLTESRISQILSHTIISLRSYFTKLSRTPFT
jgi:RNA polymerase sigma factor for flagellar operon FliA